MRQRALLPLCLCLAPAGALLTQADADPVAWCHSDKRAASVAEPFRRMYNANYKKYEAGTPRYIKGLREGEMSLDFEFGLQWWQFTLDLVPEATLLRGGVPASSPYISELYKSGSPWFSVGVDGLLNNHTYQMTRGQLETQSKVMRPDTVLSSSFADDLNKYFSKLITDYGGKKGFQQFTVGLSLSQVPRLLQLSDSPRLRSVVRRAEKVCRKYEKGCADEYKGLLLLTAMVLSTQSDMCNHPKLFMRPWLVRSNFGDMAQYLARRLGKSAVTRVVQDAVDVAIIRDLDKPMFPNGIIDYLRFPEFAEVSGLVESRVPSECVEHHRQNGMAQIKLPTDQKGLLALAKAMGKREHKIDNAILNRSCMMRGIDSVQYGPTFREWLFGIVKGKDLMSDHHSPIAESSLSHTVWKSMGQWRAMPGEEDRVYVECRDASSCISNPDWDSQTLKERLAFVAQGVKDLEFSEEE